MLADKLERAKGFEIAPSAQPISFETGVILHRSTLNTLFAVWLERRLTTFFRSRFVIFRHVNDRRHSMLNWWTFWAPATRSLSEFLASAAAPFLRLRWSMIPWSPCSISAHRMSIIHHEPLLSEHHRHDRAHLRIQVENSCRASSAKSCPRTWAESLSLV